MLKNLKIGIRLALGFGLVLVLMLIITGKGLTSLMALNQMIEKITQQDWGKAVLVNDAMDTASDNALATMELFLLTDQGKIARTLERMERNKQQITDKFDQLEARLYRPEGKALLAKAREARKPYVASFSMASRLLLEEGKTEEARQVIMTETLPHLQAFLGAINELETFQGKLLEETGVAAAQNYAHSRNLAVGLGSLALVVGAIFAFWVTRSITRPLVVAVRAANQLAEGDLTVQIDVTAKDETGQLLMATRNVGARTAHPARLSAALLSERRWPPGWDVPH
jgi:methyl-accepting chemotaxis protein